MYSSAAESSLLSSSDHEESEHSEPEAQTGDTSGQEQLDALTGQAQPGDATGALTAQPEAVETRFSQLTGGKTVQNQPEAGQQPEAVMGGDAQPGDTTVQVQPKAGAQPGGTGQQPVEIEQPLETGQPVEAGSVEEHTTDDEGNYCLIDLPFQEVEYADCSIAYEAFSNMLKNVIGPSGDLIAKLMHKNQFDDDDGIPEHPNLFDIGATLRLEDGTIAKANLEEYRLVGTAKNPTGIWIEKKKEKGIISKSFVAVFYTNKQQCSIKNLILNPLKEMCDEYDCMLRSQKTPKVEFTPTTTCKGLDCNSERVKGFRFCGKCLRNGTKLGLFDHILSQQAPSCKDWFEGEGSQAKATYKSALWTVLRCALMNEDSLRGAVKCIKVEDGLVVKEERRAFLVDLCRKNTNALDATKKKKESQPVLRKRKRNDRNERTTKERKGVDTKSPSSLRNTIEIM